MPAQATANNVIASANRFIEVRHSWRMSKQDGRNQRASMADTDPPDEVDDGKTPRHRDINAPDADANGQEIGHRIHQQQYQGEGQSKTDKPAQGRATGEDNGADLVRDRGVGVARLDDRRPPLGVYGCAVLCPTARLLSAARVLTHVSILTPRSHSALV